MQARLLCQWHIDIMSNVFSLDKDAHKAYIMRMIIIMGGVANDAEE